MSVYQADIFLTLNTGTVRNSCLNASNVWPIWSFFTRTKTDSLLFISCKKNCLFFVCVCVCRAATPATASKPTTTQKAVRKTQEGT